MAITPIQLFSPKSQKTNLASLPPLALYIHIPWCVRKCPYCDFNSHEQRQKLPEQAYIDAICRDIEASLPLIWGRRIYSVFIGGGTPSLFSGEAIASLLQQVRMLLPIDPLIEITMEANPGTAEMAHFAAYKEAGVNRLSLGIQSFNDRHLALLGRIHNSDEAKRAIVWAKQYFDNINLDLMYALPEQSLAQALDDVATALSFAPQHLSCYHLTIEPNTLFSAKPPQNLPDDDHSAEMQEQIESLLTQHGFSHYETSAFAQTRYKSKHNQNYWMFGDYLGVGAGAHSKISFHDKVIRQARYKQPQQYMSQATLGDAIQEQNTLTHADLSFEFMMNALRLTEGVPFSLFQERTSLPLAFIERAIVQAEQKGFICRHDEQLLPTALGQRFLNDLLALFLRE